MVVERRKAISPWAEFLWHPVAVLAGLPDAAAWTPLANDADAVTYYAGPAEIALHGSEADNYRRNLISGTPTIWVMMHVTGGEPPCVIGGVTADPAEGEGWTEARPGDRRNGRDAALGARRDRGLRRAISCSTGFREAPARPRRSRGFGAPASANREA